MNSIIALTCIAALNCDVKRTEPVMLAQTYIGKTTYINKCAVESVCQIDAIEVCAPLEPFTMSWSQETFGYSHEFICIDNTSKELPDLTKE